MATPEHLDYADEADRAEAWPQAMALWQRAISTSPVEQPAYAEGVARCQRQIDVDAELASIAADPDVRQKFFLKKGSPTN